MNAQKLPISPVSQRVGLASATTTGQAVSGGAEPDGHAGPNVVGTWADDCADPAGAPEGAERVAATPPISCEALRSRDFDQYFVLPVAVPVWTMSD
jgi:hypothetical protein